MLKEPIKQFIEDYMTFACKYCYDVKDFKNCSDRIHTKCLDKALFLAYKMCGKGWIRKS